jgi:hypothetical protein
MATNVMRGHAQVAIGHNFSWIQTYILRRFHPRSIFIDSIGLIWFTYYFWNHDWKAALGAAIVARAVALFSVMNINTDLFAESILGKISLLHLNPLNLVTQIIGTVVLLYGIWIHSVEMILGGLSVILLGHIFGWARVDPKLADKNGST